MEISLVSIFQRKCIKLFELLVIQILVVIKMILSQGSAYNHCFALSFWLNPLRNIMKSAAKANFPSHPMFSNSG